MCRLILASRSNILDYEIRYSTKEQSALLLLLDHLEKECGGHGNGYLMVKDRKVKEYNKGVELDNTKIVYAMLSQDYDYVIYHTRIASVGTVGDGNCHPFRYNDSALAMNGTESDFSTVARALGITDTEVIFDIVKGKSMDKMTNVLASLSSVFVGFNHGIPFAFKNNGALKESKFITGFFASSFPLGVEVDTPAIGFQWINGKRITPKKPKANYPTQQQYYKGYYGGNYNTTTWNDYDDWIAEKCDAKYDKPRHEEEDIEDMLKDVPTTSGIGLSSEDEWDAYEDGYEDGYSAGQQDAFKLLEDTTGYAG